LLHEGASIIAGLDRLLGRTWNPRRLARWRPCLTIRSRDRADAPKRCGSGGDLCEVGEEVLANYWLQATGYAMCQHFRGGPVARRLKRRRA
jgi:hypothetical protein